MCLLRKPNRYSIWIVCRFRQSYVQLSWHYLDRQMVPFTGNTGACQNNCYIGILPYWLIVEVMLAYISINHPLNFLHLCCYGHGVNRCHRMNAAELGSRPTGSTT
jgi:hypothetical protein